VEKDLVQTLAVIGREFAFDLVQMVVTKSEDDLNRMLSDLQLAEFIYEQPTPRDVAYIFKHALTQEVAYNSVLVERRKLLHGRIGAAIEALAGSQIDDHVAELAHHYGRSSNGEKTIEYLDRAGQQAMRRGALKEAELYLKQAIAALSATPETPDRIEREFNLQYALWQTLSVTSGIFTDETKQATERLRKLGEKTGNPNHLVNALTAAWNSAFAQGDMTAQRQIAEQLMDVAQRSGSRYGLTVAHMTLGMFFYFRGELAEAMQHLQAAIASYNETDFSGSILRTHTGALSRLGLGLWYLGSPDQARVKIREAISSADRSQNSADMADALFTACALYTYLREPGSVREFAERLYTLASEQQLAAFLALGSVYRGWAMAEPGRTDEGIALIRAGLDSFLSLGRRSDAQTLRLLSEAQARAGKLEEALATIEQALSAVGEMQIYLPGALWWRGELHLRRGDEILAAGDFRETITVARRIGSKAYELRATTCLARLLAKQGHPDEPRAMLADIYGQFTEGFDTTDLKDAKALLDQLSG